MYKQITPTFAPPTIEDLKDFIEDEVLMSRSIELTKMMLSNNMDLYTIGAIIKEYQTKYIYIKSCDANLASRFTPEMWWRTRQNNDE